jgi:hypothetical protein
VDYCVCDSGLATSGACSSFMSAPDCHHGIVRRFGIVAQSQSLIQMRVQGDRAVRQRSPLTPLVCSRPAQYSSDV